MITDKNHFLECPAWEPYKASTCDKKSPIVSERKNHVFKCPDHGRFAIDEDGNLIENWPNKFYGIK